MVLEAHQVSTRAYAGSSHVRPYSHFIPLLAYILLTNFVCLFSRFDSTVPWRHLWPPRHAKVSRG